MCSNCDIFTKIDLDPLYHNSPRVFIYLLASGYKSRRTSYIRWNFRFESRSKVQLPFRHRSLRSARIKVSGNKRYWISRRVSESFSFFSLSLSLHVYLCAASHFGVAETTSRRFAGVVFRSSEERTSSSESQNAPTLIKEHYKRRGARYAVPSFFDSRWRPE